MLSGSYKKNKVVLYSKLIKKNNWKYSHYLPKREQKASDRYNNEGYTVTDYNGNQWSLIYFVSYHEDREHSVAERQ